MALVDLGPRVWLLRVDVARMESPSCIARVLVCAVDEVGGVGGVLPVRCRRVVVLEDALRRLFRVEDFPICGRSSIDRAGLDLD